MALHIPEGLRDVAVDVLSLEPAKRAELLSTLKSVEPGSATGVYEQELARLFPRRSPDWIGDVIDLVFYITAVADTPRDTDAVADDLVAAFRDTDSDVVNGADDEALRNFRDFIYAVANCRDTIGLGAKAACSRAQHERVFSYSEVFSDVRRGAGNDRSRAAPITHALTIHARRQGDSEAFCFVMDYRDLLDLKRVTERAIETHRSLSLLIREGAAKTESSLDREARQWLDTDLSRLEELEPYDWGGVDPDTLGEPIDW
ncbi:MAG: hypothetical protein U5L04_17120 [Trueperaceae bacterium]|nr:hypothetical protein [Trueperaceae bacterium]